VPVDAPLYPVGLIVAGRPVLVVGGGRVAVRKVAGLLACAAAVSVVAPLIDPELEARAGAGELRLERRAYQGGDVVGYRLVLAATNDPVVNAAVFADAEAAGVWVNAADEPASCSFTLPAVARRGPITVAVSTGGHSPAMASWLRRHVEAELGEEYEVLLALLSEVRAAMLAGGRTTEGLDWLSALDSNMLELIRAGEIGRARERLEACL